MLPAGAHGDGAGSKPEWKWLQFQPSSAAEWIFVSAGPWEGKFAHTSSLNVIKQLLTEVGQPLQLLGVTMQPLPARETGDYKEMLTLGLGIMYFWMWKSLPD